MAANPPQRRRFVAQARSSLAMRLALVFGLISAVTVAAMGLSVYYLTDHYLHDRAKDELSALAAFYAAYTAATAPDQTHLSALAPQIASFFAPQGDYDVRLFGGRNGALLAATRDIGSLPSSSALALLHRRPTLFLAPSQDQPNRLYAAQPVLTADGSVLAVVEVSRPVDGMQALLGTLRLVLLATGSLAVISALIASLVLARRMVRPLIEMEAATQAIAKGDFARRLSVTSEDEIGRLAASIDQMAADLARLDASRREFIAKISHDLRTPLTGIKGFVVNLQDTAPDDMQAALATMEEQTDHLVRLVNDLLTLSRLQRGELHLRCTETDLAAIADSAVALASEKARRLGVTVTRELPDDLPAVYGDAARLQRVVLNLLDNALRATPAGGKVQVRTSSTESESRLSILDNGRGLTALEASRAFEPYSRGPGGGTGLGLTISREIVAAHGGRIWLSPRAGGGAEAGFALPACAERKCCPVPDTALEPQV
jgi:signal transduction histidine kinase